MVDKATKKYVILCTPNKGVPYYAYNMMVFTDKEKVDGEADCCNKIWGSDGKFEVVEL